jgi:magnesium transporter
MKNEIKNKKDLRVEEVPGAGFVWLDVRRPDAATLKEVKRRLPHLVEEDLDDCLPPFERPKLIEREHYLFMVLLYPIYDAKNKAIRQTEMDFFIGKDFLVMSHEGVLPEVNRFTARRALGVSPARLVVELAHELSVSRFPLLTGISNELMAIERRIFGEENGDLIRDILRVRNNILSFREAMQGHAAVFRKMLGHDEGLFNPDDLRGDCDELTSHIDDIWNFLAGDKETAEALYDSHLSLVTMRTNQAIKNLSGLAFIIFPMSLVAAIFSMRAEHMPFVGNPHDFPLMLGSIFLMMLGTTLFLRWKKWM